MLAGFDGIVAVCGHDRAFMEMCSHILVFEGDGRISDWRGSFAELRAHQKAQAVQAASPPVPPPAAPPASAGADKEAKKRASNASKKLPRVEAEVERVEGEIAAIDELLVAAGADAGKAAALAAKRAEAARLLDELFAEYERLDEVIRAGAA